MSELLIDINAMSLKELIDARPDIVAAIKAGEDEIRIATQVTKNKDGLISSWVEESRDLDGVLMGRRTDEYTYYESGEIDIIIQSIYDGEGTLLAKKEVKHFTDGRQPTVTKQ